MGKIHAVGPNKAVVVTNQKRTKIVSGGWVLACYKLENVQFMSLSLMTLTPRCFNAETAEGVPVNVSAVVHCKIINVPEVLRIAAEHFLGKTRGQISKSIELTLEGHLRAILGTLTVEEIYKDRIKFANLVNAVAAVDVAKMGIQIVSFVIKDIDDTVGYLSSLGRTKIAEVKRNANIGVAFAERDAGIHEAECERQANAVIYDMRTNIQNYWRLYNLQKSEFKREVSTAEAQAELAYALEEARIQQKIRYEELAIDIIERKKLIEIEEKEIDRKQRELVAMVTAPSEAESSRIETIALGKRTELIHAAMGDSERIKKIGEAEANKTKIVGIKEAEGMFRRAIILQKFEDVAIKQLVLNSLPNIASHISAPLAKTEEIVLVGDSNSSLAGILAVLAASIPSVLTALDITNVKKVLEKKANKEVIR